MPEAAARETKITTCQTISQPGSYELANNLTATGDCLVITADGVTIDLAGFSIVGSNTTGRGDLGQDWQAPRGTDQSQGLTPR